MSVLVTIKELLQLIWDLVCVTAVLCYPGIALQLLAWQLGYIRL
jgi:hypothetical protein